ncbi:MAG: hypothetical protein GY778_20965 [bacterium]|nr:hypothetical protein [bacterium]
MNNLADRISQGELLLLDGAMGTMLQQRGLEPGQCPEAMNLSRPEMLEEIAGLYLEAGSDLLETNTFGASPVKLADYGLADQTEAINQAAVQAVRRVAVDRACVAASVGPSGKLIKPYGEADPDDLYESFRRQIAALIEAGVDAICVETMIDLAEATLAVKAAKTVAPTTPVTATMTFDSIPRGFYTVMGVSVAQAASGLIEAGADAVGSNCGNGLEAMIAIAEEFRRCTEAPLIIQSNAGLPDTSSGTLVYPETPEFMAQRVGRLISAGVTLIGGCCGTTPEHIRAMRTAVDGVLNHGGH